MAPTLFSDKPIQLRHDYDEDVESNVSDQSVGESDTENSTETDLPSDAEDTASDSEGTESEENKNAIGDISFGALAKAQQKFQPRVGKRKHVETLEENTLGEEAQSAEERFETRKRAKEARVDAPKRTSKHAPTVESARKPVSRKRVIFEPPAAAKSRDPRFDPTVMSSTRNPNATETANRNYSFLSQYQAEEILQLKAQIKKANDPATAAELKRQVMSMESKIRNADARQRETEIRRRHKVKEKEALRAGQKSKPYYLKEADVRRLAKEERLQNMSKKVRDKAEKRHRKREKTKDSRDMPRVRRER